MIKLFFNLGGELAHTLTHDNIAQSPLGEPLDAAPAGGEAAAGGGGVLGAPSPPCLLLAGTGVAPGGRVLEASVKSVRGGLGAWGPAWGACTPSLRPPVVAPWPRPAPRAAQHT